MTLVSRSRIAVLCCADSIRSLKASSYGLELDVDAPALVVVAVCATLAQRAALIL